VLPGLADLLAAAGVHADARYMGACRPSIDGFTVGNAGLQALTRWPRTRSSAVGLNGSAVCRSSMATRHGWWCPGLYGYVVGHQVGRRGWELTRCSTEAQGVLDAAGVGAGGAHRLRPSPRIGRAEKVVKKVAGGARWRFGRFVAVGTKSGACAPVEVRRSADGPGGGKPALNWAPAIATRRGGLWSFHLGGEKALGGQTILGGAATDQYRGPTQTEGPRQSRPRRRPLVWQHGELHRHPNREALV